ncbi:hypothetical protein CONPUDRAFT_143472 [Coniophora puteana RWD-64-598 SS2]|uniref:Nucleolar pre-ribosomal-associated protein 1 C-terminal domain-containing protein n=1 Tax=Coniophora puteana (strain RWD-64-598) TaxID=741705 RepID=A0A5M3MT07_CONPW|nr:uncharacterized protein CONPUDRAFT_143472 [Coniophora puteana RWD-64-598 SS2]EIW81785.1 hypothetical protein CONPUDRAFT_143472 [Coniophora puteana RWD-64-598 SS2]
MAARPPKRARQNSQRGEKSNKQEIQKFTSSNDIQIALKNATPDSLPVILSALRSTFAVQNEEIIAPTDTRALLAHSWAESSPGLPVLFDVWDRSHPHAHGSLAPLLFLLASLLAILSPHPSGVTLLKTILTTSAQQHQYAERLAGYLGSSANDVVMGSLKLWLAMSEFGGGRERKRVWEVFPWEMKSLPKLLYMRRRSYSKVKTKANDADALARPDIRTLYVLFLLSFVSSSSTRVVFLGAQRFHLASIFKGLPTDPLPLVVRVCERLWTGLCCDARIGAGARVGVFGVKEIGEILKLYERTDPEPGFAATPDDDTDSSATETVPADVAHHFLLALCTRPGIGICFRDRGWYPRVAEEDALEVQGGAEADANGEGRQGRYMGGGDGAKSGGSGGKIYNKVLAQVLRTLRVNEDARQQELALRILSACPELVAGYWSAASLTLDPRLSSRWLANVAYAGSVISLPVPFASFVLRGSAAPSLSKAQLSASADADEPLYNPVPPPHPNILGNIFPSVGSSSSISIAGGGGGGAEVTKGLFTRGVQHTSPLVRHASALLLVRCLMKYEAVRNAFGRVVEGGDSAAGSKGSGGGGSIEVLPEDIAGLRRMREGREGGAGGGAENGGGMWAARRAELAREVRRRVPDFQVIVAFAQVSASTVSSSGATVSEAADADSGLKKDANVAVQAPNEVQQALLSEVALRLVWLYHRCVPDAVAEVRFDVGKLLLGGGFLPASVSSSGPDADVEMSEEDPKQGGGTAVALQRVKQLHILRLLKESEQFVWSAKIANSSHTPLFVLLTAFTHAPPASALRMALHALLVHLLGTSILFQNAPGTVDVWLAALPSSGNGNDEEHRKATVEFLDECVQRGMRTPYRYYEALDGFGLASAGTGRPESEDDVEMSDGPREGGAEAQTRAAVAVSPLLAVVEEQIRTKLAGRHILAASAPAVVRFARRVVVGLRGTTQDVHVLGAVGEALGAAVVVAPEEVYGGVVERLRDECAGMKMGLAWPEGEAGEAGGGDEDGSFESLLYGTPPSALTNPTRRRILVAALLGSETTFTPRRVTLERALCVLCQAIEASRTLSNLRRDLLLLVGDICRAASESSVASAKDLKDLRRWLFEENRVFKGLCTEEGMAGEVSEALAKVVQTMLDPAQLHDRKLTAAFSAYWAEVCKRTVEDGGLPEITPLMLWLPFADPAILFDLLEHFTTSPSSSRVSLPTSVLEVILHALRTALHTDATLGRRCSQLFNLRELVPSGGEAGEALEELIASAVALQLPPSCDGFAPRFNGFGRNLLDAGGMRTDTASILPENVFSQFLTQDRWTKHTAQIVAALIYARRTCVDDFAAWLGVPGTDKAVAQIETACLAKAMHAFLDCVDITGRRDLVDSLLEGHADVLGSVFERLLPDPKKGKRAFAEEEEEVTRKSSTACVALFLKLSSGPLRETMAKKLLARMKKTSFEKCTTEFVEIGVALCSAGGTVRAEGESLSGVIEGVVDRGLGWAVRWLPEKDANEGERTLGRLDWLIRHSGVQLKAHLVEPVLVAAIQSCLGDAGVVRFCTTLVRRVSLKPVIVNRLIQSTLQHPSLLKTAPFTNPHTALSRFLLALFRTHPTNTCQPSHVQPLIRIYGGTTSPGDQALLTIFRLFERTKGMTTASVLGRWSGAAGAEGRAGTESGGELEAVLSLEPIRALRTCLAFPAWRAFSADEEEYEAKGDEEDMHGGEPDVYDPVFVVALFARMLASHPPSTGMGWVEVFRTNAVSILVKCLSAKDAGLRSAALSGIVGVWKLLQDDFQMLEKAHVLYTLNILKDTLPSTENDDVPFLPSHTTLLLAQALRGIFYPSNFIYPFTARFLLQRPTLDTSDVPLLYAMLYSGTDAWKKERLWIVRFLADGMARSADWHVLKRRHTWGLLASVYQGETRDAGLRSGVIDVLVNLTACATACTALVVREGVLGWVEMMLMEQQGGERHGRMVTPADVWLKVLENVLVVVDAGTLDRATGGAWRGNVRRCLEAILRRGLSLGTLRHAVRVILRLNLLPAHHASSCEHNTELLRTALRKVVAFEQEILAVASTSSPLECTHGRHWDLALPPHRSHDVSPSEAQNGDETQCPARRLSLWGASVEELWRCISETASAGSASSSSESHVWQALTGRLLVWRAILGSEQCAVGEWARRETVKGLHVEGEADRKAGR